MLKWVMVVREIEARRRHLLMVQRASAHSNSAIKVLGRAPHSQPLQRSVHAIGLKRYSSMSLLPRNPFAQFLSTPNQVRSDSIVSTPSPALFQATERSTFDILRIGQPAHAPPPAPEPTRFWLTTDEANTSATIQALPYEFISEDGPDGSLDLALSLADYFVDTWDLELNGVDGSKNNGVVHE